MPRTPDATSAEDLAIEQLLAEDEDVIDGLAARSGPPPDTRRMSESDEDEYYAFEDRLVASDPDAFAQRLMTEGLPPEIMQRLPLFKVRPEWAEVYAQPTQDAERADMLTKLARYPLRWGLFDDVVEPTARVEKAERLDRRFQRRQVMLREQMDRVIQPSHPATTGTYGEYAPGEGAYAAEPAREVPASAYDQIAIREAP